MEITKRLYKSGHSRGLVIPDFILQAWGRPEQVDIKIYDDRIIVAPHKDGQHPKAG